jgi:hypothetical protein
MRAALVQRLGPYWKMEAANSVLVPMMGTMMVIAAHDAVEWPLALALAATSGLLVIGTIALRAHYRTVAGDALAMDRVVPLLARCQIPGIVLCLAGVAGAAVQHSRDCAWTPAVIAAWVFAALAVLEYVNYYHIQLQHFDHGPDRARLMAGQGFRASHLARALKRYRAKR